MFKININMINVNITKSINGVVKHEYGFKNYYYWW